MVAWARTVRTRGVVAATSWDAMQSPMKLNSGKTQPYGFGWFIDQVNGDRVLQHGGSWQGFRTQFTRFEASDLTVVVLTSSGAADPAAIASRIGAAVDPVRPPPPPRSIPVDDPAITAYVREMLGVAARGTLTVKDFEFVRATVVPRMSAAYARMLPPMGAIAGLDLLARGEEGDDRTFTYRVRYASGEVTAHVNIGPGGRLTRFLLEPVR